MGLSIRELTEITEGMVYDMLIESGNDSFKYKSKATQEDFDAI